MARTSSAQEPLAPCWGIDVGKDQLDVAQWPDQRHWHVPNNENGWAQLIARAAEVDPGCIVLEASGGYEVGMVLALDTAGRRPVILNPVTARRYAQSLRQFAKTDRVDARMLAQFGHERQPEPRPIRPETMRNLAALLAARDDLVASKVATTHRLAQAAAVVRPHLEEHLATLTAQIAAIEADYKRLVETDVAITATVAILCTVKGIGTLLGTTLAVCLPELGSATHGQLNALVGIAPYANDSGKRHGPRSIRGGRAKVRRALYQAVTSMRRWDPLIRAQYERLRAGGKAHKVAMVACMNRVLGLLNVMVRTGCRWEDLDVNQARTTESAH